MASINVSVYFKVFCHSLKFQKAPSLEETLCFVSTRQDLGMCSKHTR